MKKIVKKLFRLFGIGIVKIKRQGEIAFYSDYDLNLGYEFEEEANSAIKVVRKNTMLPYVNLLTLYEQIIYCERSGLEGDFVECGVWKGGAVGLMASANLKHGSKRRNLHLFDAFEEICAPNEDLDGERAIHEVKKILGEDARVKGELTPLTGIYDKYGGASDIDVCKSLIESKIGYPVENVFYHKGWFQNTIPERASRINSIAVLRLDGDWYESTKICLEHLYDKVVSGGIVIFDDYGLYEGCKKAVDEFFYSRNENYFLNYSSWACRYLIKQK